MSADEAGGICDAQSANGTDVIEDRVIHFTRDETGGEREEALSGRRKLVNSWRVEEPMRGLRKLRASYQQRVLRPPALEDGDGEDMAVAADLREAQPVDRCKRLSVGASRIVLQGVDEIVTFIEHAIGKREERRQTVEGLWWDDDRSEDSLKCGRINKEIHNLRGCDVHESVMEESGLIRAVEGGAFGIARDILSCEAEIGKESKIRVLTLQLAEFLRLHEMN